MGVFRDLPSPFAAGVQDATPGRNSQYGDRHVQPVGGTNWTFADEGSYYVANNATLATGIAGHAAPVVADTDTKALLHLYNAGDDTIFPDYVFLEVTAAGTAGTIQYTTIYIDAKGSTARDSGGTQLTPVGANTAISRATGATVFFGAVVTTMSSSRKVGQQIVREVIPVVQDTLLMVFGDVGRGAHAALTTAGTATNHAVQFFAPLAIRAGGNLNISQIRPSQSAATSYQVSFGYWER